MKDNITKKIEDVLKSTRHIEELKESQEFEALLYELKGYHMELRLQNEELKRTQEALELTRTRYTSLFENAPYGCCLYKEDGEIFRVNRRFLELAGIHESDIHKKPIYALVAPSSQDDYYFHLEELKNKQETSNGMIVFAENMSRFIAINSMYVVFKGRQYILTAFNDVTTEEISRQEIEFLSYHDRLTGLFNRHYMEYIIAENVIKVGSVIYIDINDFKLVNDVFGHELGDDVLEAIANVMSEVVLSEGIALRLGGDEFIIIVYEENVEYVKQIKARLNEEVKALSSFPVPISLSLGHSVGFQDGIQTAVNRSEKMMYYSKLMYHMLNKQDMLDYILNYTFTTFSHEQDHHEDMMRLAEELSQYLNFITEEQEHFLFAVKYMNIGYAVIASLSCDAHNRLTEEGIVQMRKHTDAGYKIIKSVPEYTSMAKVILHSHENIDGSGYPQQLSGDAIPFFSRWIHILDVYTALTEPRAYRRAYKEEEALAYIIERSGMEFDSAMVKQFERFIEVK